MAAQAGFRAHFKSQLVNRPHLLGRSRLDPPKPPHLRQRYRILEESGCRRVVLTTNHNNTLTAGASESLMWKMMAWENNYHIRAILLQGPPRKSMYSCGWDKWTLQDKGPEAAAKALARYQQLTYLVGTMRKPTISCYTGEVLGSGLGVGLGRHRISTNAAAFQVTAPSYGWCLDGAQSFVLPNLRLGGPKSRLRPHAMALSRYLALTGAPLVGQDLVLAGASTHHVSKTHIPEILASYFSDLTYESTNDFWHAEHLVTGSSELHYKLDEAFTTNPYDGLLTKWDENDEARAEMRAAMVEEVGVDGEGEDEDEFRPYEEEDEEEGPSVVFDKRLAGGKLDDDDDDEDDDEPLDESWEGTAEGTAEEDERDSFEAIKESLSPEEEKDIEQEVRRLAEEGEKGGEGGEELDLPESHMDKAMAWNPELMEAEDEEEDMVAGAKGENEPEAWRRLPDTAWLQRNFADRHEAAWRAHTDRLSEEILDKTTDEDLAAARKLALKFGPEEGDAPDYVNYPERTRLVNTFQSVRQKWLDVKSARIREQYESLGYTKEEMEAKGLKTEVDVSSINVDKAYPEFAQLVDRVAACFSGDSVEEVVERLKADNSPWAQDCLARMARMSPLSLKLVWRQLEEGDQNEFDDALRAEHRVATRLLHNPEVLEAMRMGLGDKRGLQTGEAAPWGNKTLGSITADEIEAYFQPLPAEQELQLPTRTFDGGRETVGLTDLFANRTRTSA